MRKRMSAAGLAAIAATIIASVGGLVSLGTSAAAAATCTGGTSTDFNGDGVTDTVVADPNATVNGAKQAGLVRVVLGGGKGIFEISQATAGMGATPERGDQFGYSRASYDADGDGCTDLVVGAPYEDVPQGGGNLVDAGAIWVIHGTPSGIGAGSTIESYTQAQLDSSTVTEEYDRFGFALKAGDTSDAKPYLVVGVPGENVTIGGTDFADAGCIHYIQGSTKMTVNQDDPGVPGVVEAHDRFGYSLAGTNRYFAVGAPGEAIGDEEFAGGVTVFSHTLTNGLPTALAGLDQGASGEGLAGVAEAGDGFGTSISMANYRPSDQTYNSDALLAIGTPGEDIGTVPDAGTATVIRIKLDGTYSEIAAMDAGVTDVDGDPTAGDFFGQRVTIANTDTSVVSSAATIRLAVGIPGREAGSVKDAGAVQIFRPLDSSVGAKDKILTRAASGSVLPGTATSRDYTGIAMTSGATNLYLGVPYSKASDTPKGALYVIPWTDIDGTTSTGTTTYKPGADGIPDSGTSFGVVG
ncbi:VCBS repeat-containing protein [Streptomyces sp. NBC_00562]|uniref:VCBS repeat-containing protein n=1 Tax=Streptomyces sp. NBC_00562 TaxID=2975777 RepID=UPI002E81BAAC|nr:VCBS repeat-containing protein [Streptomyces sp. NBC_00562]WUC22177.1 VCBS repeat-containing protein [Streptomyces sp. NBC_00562]